MSWGVLCGMVGVHAFLLGLLLGWRSASRVVSREAWEKMREAERINRQSQEILAACRKLRGLKAGPAVERFAVIDGEGGA